MNGVEGVDALLAVIDDLRDRLAAVEAHLERMGDEVVTRKVRAGRVSAGEVVARRAEVSRPGGGVVLIGAGPDHAEINMWAREADNDAPAVSVTANLEGVDGRGRDLAEAAIYLRTNEGLDGLELGARATAGTPGAGFVTVRDGATDRISLHVAGDGQAAVDVSGGRNAVALDAGPAGAGICTERGGLREWVEPTVGHPGRS